MPLIFERPASNDGRPARRIVVDAGRNAVLIEITEGDRTASMLLFREEASAVAGYIQEWLRRRAAGEE